TSGRSGSPRTSRRTPWPPGGGTRASPPAAPRPGRSPAPPAIPRSRWSSWAATSPGCAACTARSTWSARSRCPRTGWRYPPRPSAWRTTSWCPGRWTRRSGTRWCARCSSTATNWPPCTPRAAGWIAARPSTPFRCRCIPARCATTGRRRSSAVVAGGPAVGRHGREAQPRVEAARVGGEQFQVATRGGHQYRRDRQPEPAAVDVLRVRCPPEAFGRLAPQRVREAGSVVDHAQLHPVAVGYHGDLDRRVRPGELERIVDERVQRLPDRRRYRVHRRATGTVAAQRDAAFPGQRLPGGHPLVRRHGRVLDLHVVPAAL